MATAEPTIRSNEDIVNLGLDLRGYTYALEAIIDQRADMGNAEGEAIGLLLRQLNEIANTLVDSKDEEDVIPLKSRA